MPFKLYKLRRATECNNVLSMEHAQWVDELITPDNRRTASKKAGLSESTLSRQLQRGNLPPESAIALCRIYGRPPVDGLVELGYIDSHEVTPGIRVSVSTMTNQQISDLLAAISEEVLARSLDDDSLRNVTSDESPADADVFDFPDSGATPDVSTLHEYGSVADSSPDHDEEDTDFD